MAHVAKYKLGDLGRMLGHYGRWGGDVERAARREHIDAARTPGNWAVGDPERIADPAGFVVRRIEGLGRTVRRDAVRMCDCVLTMPQGFDRARAREFFESAARFLEARYGADNAIGGWVHVDEATPHMHWAWVPVTPDGRLSAKDVVTRADLRTLHGDMQRAMERDLGCRVEILLDDGKQAQKDLSRLDQRSYREAKDEIERARQEAAEASRAADEAAARMEAAQRAERAARAAQEAAEAAMRQAEERAKQARARLESLRRDRDAAEERIAKLEGERSAVYERLAGLPEKAERDADELRKLAARKDALERDVRGLGERLQRAATEIQALAHACWRAGATLYARLSRWGREALGEAGYRVRDPLERSRGRGMDDMGMGL